MTDRGLPIVDGAPACPFVAFEDDRDGRSPAPDHRHRCFAEAKAAPRALAHQEAYCLSSAFPVCPTFQDWARREAAAARPLAAGTRPVRDETPTSTPLPPRNREARHPPVSDAPAPIEPRRNAPRPWAAPPPWSGDDAPPDDEPPVGRERTRPADGWGAASRGLAGSAADRLAGPDPDAPVAATPASYTVSPVSPSAGRPGGRAPSDDRHRQVQDPAEVFGPAWERPRRYEAYPTLKTRVGLPSMGALPRVAVAAVSLLLAAAVLFFVGPMLLGLGGRDPGSGTVTSPRPSVLATATPLPTVPPAPTPTVYIVAKGDTMSKIARRFGLTIEQLRAANPKIKDPNKIKIGDQIIIPVVQATDSTGVGGASAAP